MAKKEARKVAGSKKLVASMKTGKVIVKPAKIKKAPTEFGLVNIIAIVVLLGIFSFTALVLTRFESKTNTVKPQKNIETQTISYDCTDGQTALAVLKTKADVQTQDSSDGAYVTSINNASNTDQSFWIYYVNGQMSSIGPDQYNCKTGDKVEWRLEQIL